MTTPKVTGGLTVKPVAPPLKPVILMAPVLADQVRHLVHSTGKNEVQWYHTVRKMQNPNDPKDSNTYYLLENLVIPWQTVSGGEADTDGAQQYKTMQEIKARFNLVGPNAFEIGTTEHAAALEAYNAFSLALRGWCHSHVEMGVTPSGQDNNQWQQMITECDHGNEHPLVMLIWNKRDEVTSRVYDPATPGQYYESVPVQVMQRDIDTQYIDESLAEKVTTNNRTTTTVSNTSSSTTGSSNQASQQGGATGSSGFPQGTPGQTGSRSGGATSGANGPNFGASYMASQPVIKAAQLIGKEKWPDEVAFDFGVFYGSSASSETHVPEATVEEIMELTVPLSKTQDCRREAEKLLQIFSSLFKEAKEKMLLYMLLMQFEAKDEQQLKKTLTAYRHSKPKKTEAEMNSIILEGLVTLDVPSIEFIACCVYAAKRVIAAESDPMVKLIIETHFAWMNFLIYESVSNVATA